MVEIEWLDSIGSSGWMTAKNVLEEVTPKYLRHRSCGYLMLDDGEDGIVLLQSYQEEVDPDDGDTKRHVQGAMRIPRGAVVAIRELKPA
jgi:hypothetical protein